MIEQVRGQYPSITVGQHKEYDQTACPGANFPFTFRINPEDEDGVESDVDKPSEWAREA